MKELERNRKEGKQTGSQQNTAFSRIAERTAQRQQKNRQYSEGRADNSRHFDRKQVVSEHIKQIIKIVKIGYSDLEIN